ncbi:MAG TPA: hypothetical protein VGR63_19085 [Casimicrobiaceae bacterium]|nr:hypothetical protein [Casimicrobiaceae bacterium]
MQQELVKYVAWMLAKIALEGEGIVGDRDAETRLTEVILDAVQTWLDVGEQAQ